MPSKNRRRSANIGIDDKSRNPNCAVYAAMMPPASHQGRERITEDNVWKTAEVVVKVISILQFDGTIAVVRPSGFGRVLQAFFFHLARPNSLVSSATLIEDGNIPSEL